MSDLSLPLVAQRYDPNGKGFHCPICGEWVGRGRDNPAVHNVALHQAVALERIAESLARAAGEGDTRP